MCNLPGEHAQRTYLTVELGLQTVHDTTGERINRCHSYADFLAGCEKLRVRGVKVDPHLVKIYLLHLLEGTAPAQAYRKRPFSLMTRAEYVRTVCDQLE